MKPALDINPQFKKALQLMRANKKSLFITGKAGTGKSTLLNYFCRHAANKPVVLAPTGVAALNVKGQTIHSFFNFYIDVTVEKIKNKKSPIKNPQLYKNLKSLIVDEVSMLRADLTDCIDVFLRRYGPKEDRAFGGVQMIFVGDLYQLPPVVSTKEKNIFNSYYKTPFFFSARAFENFEMEVIELDKVYRQKDTEFVNLLNRIRNKSAGKEDMDRLNSRYQPSFNFKSLSGKKLHISLSALNRSADKINENRLQSLKGKMFQSTALVKGVFGKEYFPTSPDLLFKAGAQIMLLNNDSKRRWVNGSIGVLKDFDDREGLLKVQLSNGKLVYVPQYTWEIYRFSFSKTRQTIHSELAGSFTQFPFRLAWAITIHKSQGKTFDQVILDPGQGMFACGQAYVALSRCVSFEGLVLTSKFKKSHIQIDHRIFDFLTKGQYQKSERDMPLPEKIQYIQTAIKNKSFLKITYLKANDMKLERVIAPVEVGRQEYLGREFQGLRAFCQTARAERMFRVDRILTLQAY